MAIVDEIDGLRLPSYCWRRPRFRIGTGWEFNRALLGAVLANRFFLVDPGRPVVRIVRVSVLLWSRTAIDGPGIPWLWGRPVASTGGGPANRCFGHAGLRLGRGGFVHDNVESTASVQGGVVKESSWLQ